MIPRILAITALILTLSGCASKPATTAATPPPAAAPVAETSTSWTDGAKEWSATYWRERFEDPAQVERIAPGKSTRQDVRQLFGEPTAVSTLNGEEKWTYKSYRTVSKSYWPTSNAKGGSMQTIEVFVFFTPQGVVKNLESQKQQW
jgi:outer membrane protein assembly factor BamE (lipoprotein component of BamABCDE complex)